MIVARRGVLHPPVRQSVEVVEQVGLLGAFVLAPRRLLAQVLDQSARMNLLLDVDRGRSNFEWRAVLRILAAPDELRIEVGVARIAQNLQRLLVVGY